MRKCIIFSWVILLFCACNNKNELTIHYVGKKTHSDIAQTKKQVINYQWETFIIKNFNESPDSDSLVKKFAFDYAKNKKKVANFYSIVFYKASESTVWEKTQEYPDKSYRYIMPDDIVYEYCWENGTFQVEKKYKNGVQIDPANSIKIEQVK